MRKRVGWPSTASFCGWSRRRSAFSSQRASASASVGKSTPSMRPRCFASGASDRRAQAPGLHDLGGGEEAVVLTARVLFGKSEAPGEFAPGAVPCRLVVRIESAPDRGLELVESPLAREEPRDGVDPVIPQVGEPAARDAGSCGRSVEETPSFLWHLRCQVEAVGQRERDGKTMMNLQKRVVVGRDDTRDIGLVEAQILPPRMGPPRIEGRRVEPRPVPVVVEPQTEARAAQSERPDLRVLAVAALRPLLSLIRQV